MKKILLLLYLCSIGTSVFAQGAQSKYLSVSEATRLLPKKLGKQAFIVFPEVKDQPIQWLDSLRINWLQKDYSQKPYSLQAQPGEYFVFQTGIWAIWDQYDIREKKMIGYWDSYNPVSINNYSIK